MKKIADAFVFITAALVIPPTFEAYFHAFYEKNKASLLIGSAAAGLLITILNSVKIDKESTTLYKLKHEIFTIKNITVVVLSIFLFEFLSPIVLSHFHISYPSTSLSYAPSVAVIYILFLLVTDQVPLSQGFHMTRLYDGTKKKMSGFHGANGGPYDQATHSETKPFSTGDFKIASNALTINRTNTDGRFKLTLIEYPYKQKTIDHIPVNPLMKTSRIINVSCQVRAPEGIHHTLVFAFADSDKHNWFQSSNVDVASSDWQPVRLSLSVSAASKLKLRIDDINVSAPSSVSIRNLKIIEKD